jgi:hypothetical protein
MDRTLVVEHRMPQDFAALRITPLWHTSLAVPAFRRQMKGTLMETTLRSPRTGDTVIVLAKMQTGVLTELSGLIEDTSTDRAYFGLDSISLSEDNKDFYPPLQQKNWPKNSTNLLRIGVPFDQMKPFDGKLDEDSPCWVVRV